MFNEAKVLFFCFQIIVFLQKEKEHHLDAPFLHQLMNENHLIHLLPT